MSESIYSKINKHLVAKIRIINCHSELALFLQSLGKLLFKMDKNLLIHFCVLIKIAI